MHSIVPFGLSLFLIAAFPALSPLSIDVVLPALGHIERQLEADHLSVGLSISLFVLGFAVSQIVCGPASDRLGRRPVLLGGALTFACAGVGCCLATSIGYLLAWRALQGIGGGCCTVLAFAIIRDRYEGATARVAIAYVNALMWLVPLIGPGAGILLIRLGSWRLVFAALAACGTALVLLVWCSFEETIGDRRADCIDLSRIVSNYRSVLANRSARASALIVGLTFGCMFAYVAGAPFVFLDYLKVEPSRFAVIFACIGAGLTTGSLLSSFLTRKDFAGATLLRCGILMLLATSVGLLALALLGIFTVLPALVLLFINTTALGLAMPAAVQGVLQPFPEMAGSASAVQGCFRMIGATVSSALVALLHDGTAWSMVTVMTLFACAAGLVWLADLRPSQFFAEETRSTAH